MIKVECTLTHRKLKKIELLISGRSSGVERNLAKVEVEGSNPFARSNRSQKSFSITLETVLHNTYTSFRF